MYYQRLAGSKKFSHERRLRGMTHWINDYLTADVPEQSRTAVLNGMREINAALRDYYATNTVAKKDHVLAALDTMDKKIAHDHNTIHTRVQPVEHPVAKPQSWYQRMATPLKAAAAGALLYFGTSCNMNKEESLAEPRAVAYVQGDKTTNAQNDYTLSELAELPGYHAAVQDQPKVEQQTPSQEPAPQPEIPLQPLLKQEPVKPQESPQQPKAEQPPAAQPRTEKPEEKTYTPRRKLEDPWYDSRILARGDVGSAGSSQDRGASLDARISGIHVIGELHRNKYDALNGDDVVEQGVGAYLGADLDRLVGLPVTLSAAFDDDKYTRESGSSSKTITGPFTITTRTDTEEETIDEYRAASLGVKLGKTKLGLTGFLNEQEIDVSVRTQVGVVNSADPTGNYNQLIPLDLSFTNETKGAQFMLEHQVSNDFSAGGYLTLELTELKDFDRNIDLYRMHLFGKYRSPNKRYGASFLLGQGLLDDTGDKNDEFTKGEYIAIAGAELTPWLTAAGQFSFFDDPQGSAILLFGKSDHALEHILDKEWVEDLSELDLIKNMSDDQQRIYLFGRHTDLNRALAQQNELLGLIDVGAARVKELGGEKNVFNGRATIFVPASDSVTLTIGPYVQHSDLTERKGVELGVYPVGSGFAFGADVSQEDVDGRAQKDEEFRSLIFFEYILGGGSKK